MNELEKLSLYATVLLLYFALFFLSSIPDKAKVGGSWTVV
jgi:hypothetical protein